MDILLSTCVAWTRKTVCWVTTLNLPYSQPSKRSVSRSRNILSGLYIAFCSVSAKSVLLGMLRSVEGCSSSSATTLNLIPFSVHPLTVPDVDTTLCERPRSESNQQSMRVQMVSWALKTKAYGSALFALNFNRDVRMRIQPGWNASFLLLLHRRNRMQVVFHLSRIYS